VSQTLQATRARRAWCRAYAAASGRNGISIISEVRPLENPPAISVSVGTLPRTRHPALCRVWEIAQHPLLPIKDFRELCPRDAGAKIEKSVALDAWDWRPAVQCAVVDLEPVLGEQGRVSLLTE